MGTLRLPEIDESTGKIRPAFIPDLSGEYVPQLPTLGTYTYNVDGTVASDPDGNVYGYNVDGSVHTITKSGVTRTAAYDGSGNITGWA